MLGRLTKNPRTLLGIAATVLFSAVAYLAFQPKQSLRNFNPNDFIVALRRYSSEQRAAGNVLPQEISARELVARGYLQEHFLNGFEGMELSISFTRMKRIPTKSSSAPVPRTARSKPS